MAKREVIYRSEAHGTLVFANGLRVDGGWRFTCSWGFATSRLRGALEREARKQRIPGRSKIVRFEASVRPLP